MSTRSNWLLLTFLLCSLTAIGQQIQVTHPVTRQIVQRGLDNNGQLFVCGQLSVTSADRVEGQLTPIATGQGTATAWQSLTVSVANRQFWGLMTGTGGWYQLTVRVIRRGQVIASDVVTPVGIGEVFVTAGQSNSRGLGIGDNDLGSVTDRVSTIDTINYYLPAGAVAISASADPMPAPTYKSLSAARRIFPMGESSWGWGELGDYLVNRYNVPVAFYDAGWDASTVENWINTANGIAACNRYYCTENWPNLQPYTNLRNALNYYGTMNGVRAVLWHQGEAEYGDLTTGTIPDYPTRLRALIQKARQDFNNRPVSFVVARVSFDGSTTRPDLITQQQAVINTAGLSVFQGPLNDTIQNRNAGLTDVHFRNGQRISPHPRYFENPTTANIPADMGLSRFARNWNNSLTNTFFTTASPVLPVQFLATGLVAGPRSGGAFNAGESVSVQFVTVGTFNSDNRFQLQLLDAAGRFLAVLTDGTTAPLTLTWPSNRASGQYRLRVVSTNPVVAGAASPVFTIGQPTYTDEALATLRLTADVSRRTVSLNDQLTVTLRLRNVGPGTAKNVTVQNQLPAGLSVLSANGLSAQSGLLAGTVAQVTSGGSAVFSFVAQPTSAGVFRNAAEVIRNDTDDTDSQPNSGTGDGQADATNIDFRTRDSGTSVFASPNPNQVPLPAVSLNQPTPDPAKADLSLSLTTNRLTANIGDIISYTLTVNNLGGLTATGVGVTAYLPANQTFASGDDLTPGNGGLTNTIGSIAVGTPATLRFRARLTATGSGDCTAQITQSNQPDPDSTPNNGLTNGEDDTARLTVRSR